MNSKKIGTVCLVITVFTILVLLGFRVRTGSTARGCGGCLIKSDYATQQRN